MALNYEVNGSPVEVKHVNYTKNNVTTPVNYLVKDNKLVFADSGLYLSGLNNYTKVGSPNIVDNVVSGFSNNNYISILGVPHEIEFVIKFGTGTDVTTRQLLCSSSRLLDINILNGYVTAWNYYSRQMIDLFAIGTNTNYYIKTVITYNTKTYYYSQNGIAYTLSMELNDTSGEDSNDLYLGRHNSVSGYQFDGSIDFNYTYIKAVGDLWLYGKNYASKNIAPVPAGYTYGTTTTPSIGWVDMRTQAFTAAPSGATIGRDE